MAVSSQSVPKRGMIQKPDTSGLLQRVIDARLIVQEAYQIGLNEIRVGVPLPYGVTQPISLYTPYIFYIITPYTPYI